MVNSSISGEGEVALILIIVVVAEAFLSGVAITITTITTIITIITTIIDINNKSLRLRSLTFHNRSLLPLKLRLKNNLHLNLRNIKTNFAQTGYLPIKLINTWSYRRLKGWNRSKKS